MITRAALKSSMQQNCHPKKSSTLSGTTVISDEDYEHAKKVWKEFDMKAIGNYHDHYLKTDVRLPADVFEEFRKVCHENKLDSVQYYTTPGLAWDSALKETNDELELLTDADMLFMTESKSSVSKLVN